MIGVLLCSGHSNKTSRFPAARGHFNSDNIMVHQYVIAQLCEQSVTISNALLHFFFFSFFTKRLLFCIFFPMSMWGYLWVLPLYPSIHPSSTASALNRFAGRAGADPSSAGSAPSRRLITSIPNACLNCGRKLEYLERTHTDHWRTCKLHRERPLAPRGFKPTTFLIESEPFV